MVHTVSTNPADVIPQSNLILIIVPAFAHKPILEYVYVCMEYVCVFLRQHVLHSHMLLFPRATGKLPPTCALAQ